MARAFYLLDEPRDWSVRARVWTAALLAGYGGLVLAAVITSPIALPRNPGFALAHALVGAFVCGITALLLVTHAQSTGQRGYLAVAVVFWYLTVILIAFPMIFSGALVPEVQLWGGPQSAPDLYFAWHLVFPIGIAGSAWVIYSDRKRLRRPDRTTGRIVAGLVVASVSAALTVSLVVFGWELLPDVVAPGGDAKTGYALALDVTVTVLAIACVVITFYCARNGSLIGRWLTAVSLLLLGEAIVNEYAPIRFSAGWYSGRVMWLVTSATLLVALIWNLSRVDRANTELATIDSLTGCKSRVALVDSLQREMGRLKATGGRVGLLWIDIDTFKGVNDQLGHRVGDDVLRQIVERITAQVRPSDHVGRLGGDEFGVLLCDDVNRIRTAAVAARILAAIREPIRSGENLLLLTASVGGAMAPDDAMSPESLLLCADLAMYASKNRAGDRFEWYQTTIGARAVERARLRHALTAAIVDQDFCLYYQPIVETASNRMAGAEALVRWSRDGEIVTAGEFIPNAEASGQIVAIGRLVIDMLCQDLPVWVQNTDDDFFVSVNLSVKELADQALIDDLLRGVGVADRRRLVVELTESLELEGNEEAQRNLARLRQAGIRTAIDDFGTGFSNFTRLERLEPSILKVDRSLVRRAAAQAMADGTFLSAATSVAASLRCHVVAEGVDSEASMRVVRRPGIRYAQGYSYGMPAPMEKYLSRLEAP